MKMKLKVSLERLADFKFAFFVENQSIIKPTSLDFL